MIELLIPINKLKLDLARPLGVPHRFTMVRSTPGLKNCSLVENTAMMTMMTMMMTVMTIMMTVMTMMMTMIGGSSPIRHDPAQHLDFQNCSTFAKDFGREQ